MSADPHDLSQFSMRDLFGMEADAQSRQLTDGLLALERGGGDAATLEGLMRAAHSIKGAAAIVGLDVVVQLAHGMEDAFIGAQRGTLELSPARIDVLLAAVDLVAQVAGAAEPETEAWLVRHGGRIAGAMAALRTIAQPDGASAAPHRLPAVAAPAPFTAVAPEPEPAPQRAAGPAASDELLALASESRVNAHKLEAHNAALQRFKRQQASLLHAIEQLHESVAAIGDPGLLEQSALALARAQPLKQFLHQHMADAESHERRATRVSARLVDEVLALRMCPFGDGVHAFPRMVRDLARSLGKEAQLVIGGARTPVDRAVLARIESPLNHLLRNALDHGLETPAERLAAGKPAHGTIRLEARHRAGMLVIEIGDDGRGVDPERIRAAVVARNLSSAAMAAALSEAELMEFLFLPGFSLKETANQISGRGVGLDVVQQEVRAQNGALRLESRPGHGFSTWLTLPLTQSIVRALVVEVRGEAYAFPIARVERVLKVAHDAIHTLENRQFFELDGVHHGLVAAAQVLGLGEAAAAAELPVLVLGAGQSRYALVVDAIRAEQSLTVQSLEPAFGKLRDIAAAAVLDDGAPVLIVDVPDLLLSIDKLLREGALQKMGHDGAAGARGALRILVVDDSLTVREMERKLLQGRGYRVDTAQDGIDGWNMVRGADYDLVVTDIDMPRMDGIELVGLIRQDPRLHKLPVMIVSYKDRPEDRARGMSAGADYYLAKGSFHDATLLDAVSDLIGEAAQ